MQGKLPPLKECSIMLEHYPLLDVDIKIIAEID
jgi:hypothetical protein